MNSKCTRPSMRFQSLLALAKKLALATLCGLLLVSGSLAQEQRPEPTPGPPTPEASATPKAPDPNETGAGQVQENHADAILGYLQFLRGATRVELRDPFLTRTVGG